jgi:hypothetical protein
MSLSFVEHGVFLSFLYFCNYKVIFKLQGVNVISYLLFWCMFVISDTWEVEIRRSRFKTNQGTKLVRPTSQQTS